MAIKNSNKPIPVKLDAALLERIEKMAIKMGEGKSTVMRIAMRIGLDGLESAFNNSPEKTLSSLTYRSRPEDTAAVALNEAEQKKKKTGS